MASYTYTGNGDREFPTLVLTVKPGDTFDAPADFVAADVTPATASKKTVFAADPTPAAPSATTQGA
jgi:hypothetical protein